MKLEIARSLFAAMALSVAIGAGVMLSEPPSGVVGSEAFSYCHAPRGAGDAATAQRPSRDMLLLLFGLAQGKN